MAAVQESPADSALDTYAEGILAKYSAEFAGMWDHAQLSGPTFCRLASMPIIYKTCKLQSSQVLRSMQSSLSCKLPANQVRDNSLSAACTPQMEAQMHTAASFVRRYSVCGSSCTAHAAMWLYASSAWRTCIMILQSGTATEAAAVCCTWCAYKPGAASRWLLPHTPLHLSPPGARARAALAAASFAKLCIACVEPCPSLLSCIVPPAVSCNGALRCPGLSA